MRISWSVGATTYCYLKCTVYGNLSKLRQSSWITLYIRALCFIINIGLLSQKLRLSTEKLLQEHGYRRQCRNMFSKLKQILYFSQVFGFYRELQDRTTFKNMSGCNTAHVEVHNKTFLGLLICVLNCNGGICWRMRSSLVFSYLVSKGSQKAVSNGEIFILSLIKSAGYVQ
jgi:hypothetical protein